MASTRLTVINDIIIRMKEKLDGLKKELDRILIIKLSYS